MSDNSHKPFGATLFSRALYSSWCHVPRYEILFDCGEGCALNLGNDSVNVQKIFLGHGHGDHTLGLISFIGARNNAQGISRNPKTRDHNKPLEIFYPAGDKSIEEIISFCSNRHKAWLRYDLDWTPIQVGSEIDIGTNTYIKAFEMAHQVKDLTLGYVIRENRKRLKPEYEGRDIRQLIAEGKIDKSRMSEEYSANLFAYCLDSCEMRAGADLWKCEHAVMDCTFLDKNDRTDITHFTIDEALLYCHNIGIKNMYAAHVSPRYDGRDVKASFTSEITTVHSIDSMKPNKI